jgi:hypothetical protein
MDYSKGGLAYGNLYTETVGTWIGTLSHIGIYIADSANGIRIPWFRVEETAAIN